MVPTHPRNPTRGFIFQIIELKVVRLPRGGKGYLKDIDVSSIVQERVREDNPRTKGESEELLNSPIRNQAGTYRPHQFLSHNLEKWCNRLVRVRGVRRSFGGSDFN